MELTTYLNNSVEHIFIDAIRSFYLNPKELMFLSKNVKVQKAAAQKRLLSKESGAPVPPFLIASIATKCNLHCAGCYARANHACTDESSINEMSAGRWGEIFKEASDMGISFILLAGGEPLERADVIYEAIKTPEIIFPVFTNGTLFTEAMLAQFDDHRNLVPVISIEGDRAQTDERRGAGVFDIIGKTMKEMTRRGMLYGVSITVTKENLDTVTGDAYISALKEIGCRLVFYVEYVPADGNTAPALEETDRLTLETRQSKLKENFNDMIIISFPGDEKMLGGCLAAGRGFFHINAVGGAEPCPFSPYSDISLKDQSLRDALNCALFRQIRENHFEAGEHIGGCVLFSRKAEVEELLAEGY